VRAEILDLASLASVRSFAAKLGAEPKLDLLINNAGVMKVPTRELTEDGFERQFATNFLGHFALTGLLLPVLLRASGPRVTTISSIAAKLGVARLRFDDLQCERGYDPWTAYCRTKLADLMFALELGRRCAARNLPLLSNAAHPGYSRTNVQTSGPGKPPGRAVRILERIAAQDAFHGALPTLRAATEISAAPGSYYGPDGFFQIKGDPVAISIPEPAHDEGAARKLWEIAEGLTGVVFSA
jgi:NAD(P)-dependent dehydrogenase (short-subunit alcohol dehydrogenase family)